MSERLFFCDDLVVSTAVGSEEKFGLVKQVGGFDDSDASSDTDSENSLQEVKKGYLRVKWVLHGKSDTVAESSVRVVDRSCLPRDVVRVKGGQQLGTALSTSVTCDVFVKGTRKVLKGVNVSDLVPLRVFEVDQFVTRGPWIGRIRDTTERIILRLNNGSRISMDPVCFEDLDNLIVENVNVDDDEPYPGQMLTARGKFFKDIEWLSGERINFRMKNYYKMRVEQIWIVSMKIVWAVRATTEYTTADSNDETNGTPVDEIRGTSVDAVNQAKREDPPIIGPPTVFHNKDFHTLKKLDHFWQGHVWVTDKFRYQLNASSAYVLNNPKMKPDKNVAKAKLRKRLKKILRKSTSEECLSKYNRQSSSQADDVSSNDGDVSSDGDDKVYTDDDSSNDGDVSSDGDDEDSELGGMKCDITPSSGARASVEAVDDAIDIIVTNTSDLNINSATGPGITILGTVSCQFAQCQLDFALLQKMGTRAKMELLCNIQYPGYSENMVAKMGKEFRIYMRSMLMKNMYLLDASSYKSLMSHCPQAVRAFVKQESTLSVTDVYYEYLADCQRTSGVIDKSGAKREVVFEGDAKDFTGLNQISQIASNQVSPVTVPDEFEATRSSARNTKFVEGQWVTVELRQTYTKVDVQWQDGTIQNNIEAKDLYPASHVDDQTFCPGDFVYDLREESAEDNYGVVVTMDNKNKMARVRWMEGNPKVVEEVSTYDIEDYEQIQFRISDIITRMNNSYETDKKNCQDRKDVVGELLRVTEYGMLKVLWSDGTISLVHPLDVSNTTKYDDDDSIFASSKHEDTSWATESTDDVRDTSSESGIIGDAETLESALSGELTTAHGQDRGEGALRRNENEASSESEQQIDSETSEESKNSAVSHLVDHIVDSIVHEFENTSSIPERPSSESLNGQNGSMHLMEDEEEGRLEDIEYNDESQQDDTAANSSQPLMEGTSLIVHGVAPSSHHFAGRSFTNSGRDFMKALQRDIELLRSSLPPGITVYSYEDRMDLLSVLVEGPSRTPYENGLFSFHIHLPCNYPQSPPAVHYISQSLRLNPNLYECGNVCVSLLGTWSGKGNEVWTKDSTILQVLLSIQGLILNSEPYYNEAGYEAHRGTAEGATNSRCYNEMVTLRLVQHTTYLLDHAPEEFTMKIKEYCKKEVPLLIARIKSMVQQSEAMDSEETSEGEDLGFPLLPLSKGVRLSLQNRLLELESVLESRNDD